ncbi:hypothetical protein MRS76_08750 [Rhizobiaceae bacterium n13]|uniref:Uncharacterized protein n=1 Tax=Ferirhizobium litorale TaxID=2927786 RepID=A0AAE3QFQ3_9HYPH|nr:hypothetical protein [Fererhizobium litorale]MDI7862043.1 hypothetical protein [Fererhizobium litorale]MDI7922685.1 hypothetical protein [Fererhizobium litorale]
MNLQENPFPNDADRTAIWDMLVRRDIAAFIGQDWAMVSGDFDETRFLGIHAHNSPNPDDWKADFHSLSVYRDEWLRQAAETAATAYAEPLSDAIFRATRLTEIDITGDVAVARKKFDGSVRRADGGEDRLNWQTLYFCRKGDDGWKITGFVGYMKYK